MMTAATKKGLVRSRIIMALDDFDLAGGVRVVDGGTVAQMRELSATRSRVPIPRSAGLAVAVPRLPRSAQEALV